MANNTPAWDDIVATVRAKGDNATTQIAIEEQTLMPVDEAGVVQVGDDEFIIHAGTADGTVVIREDSVTYGDGHTEEFEDDDHRAAVVHREVPDFITKHLK